MRRHNATHNLVCWLHLDPSKGLRWWVRYRPIYCVVQGVRDPHVGRGTHGGDVGSPPLHHQGRDLDGVSVCVGTKDPARQ